jgi:copper homeostasis protein (lipoprotein)
MSNKLINIGFTCIAFFLVSCNSSSSNPEAGGSRQPTNDSIVIDGHNSANSLDIEGTYKGNLPCADCEGIETEITLNKDLTFVKRSKYLGKDNKVFEESGSYSWNQAGNTITLSSIKNAPNQYFVGENIIQQLDMEGRKITGDLAEKYILTK